MEIPNSLRFNSTHIFVFIFKTYTSLIAAKAKSISIGKTSILKIKIIERAIIKKNIVDRKIKIKRITEIYLRKAIK